MRVVMLLCVLMASAAESSFAVTAEDLFVRPQADCSINGNGRAYDCASQPGGVGAFRGFAAMRFSGTDETVGKIDPGDTVHVCGKFTASDIQQPGTMINTAVAGPNNATITYDGNCAAYGGESTATLDGGGTVANGFYTAQRTLFTIQNLVIQNFTSRGLLLYGHAVTDVPISKRILVQDVTVSNIRGKLATCLDMRGQDITIQRVTYHHCGSDGLYHHGKRLVVDRVNASHISLDAGNAGDAVQVSGEVGGFSITNSILDMSAVDSKYCVIVIGVTDTGSFLIEGNTCIRGSTHTTGSGYLIDSAAGMTATVRKNTVSGGANGIQIFNQDGTVIIEENQVKATTNDGILLGGKGKGMSMVRNNTIIGPARHGISNSNPNVSSTIQGNNVSAAASCIEQQSSHEESANSLAECGNAVTVNGRPASMGRGTKKQP